MIIVCYLFVTYIVVLCFTLNELLVLFELMAIENFFLEIEEKSLKLRLL